MPKVRSKFVCQNCSYQSPKSFGRCPNCGQFNTMVEEIIEAAKPVKQDRRPAGVLASAPQRFSPTAFAGDQRRCG